MNLKEYSERAFSTAKYPGRGDGKGSEWKRSPEDVPSYKVSWNHMYPSLKLAGESGEFTEKVGKIIRDGNLYYDEVTRVELAKELGDILWYVNACAIEFGFSLEEIAQMNLDKLASRKERNQIHGSGDNR